jgi:hypothetical protein
MLASIVGPVALVFVMLFVFIPLVLGGAMLVAGVLGWSLNRRAIDNDPTSAYVELNK